MADGGLRWRREALSVGPVGNNAHPLCRDAVSDERIAREPGSDEYQLRQLDLTIEVGAVPLSVTEPRQRRCKPRIAIRFLVAQPVLPAMMSGRVIQQRPPPQAASPRSPHALHRKTAAGQAVRATGLRLKANCCLNTTVPVQGFSRESCRLECSGLV
jgi:hypothetical protein